MATIIIMLFSVVGGLGGLILGSELLIKGASRLAALLGVSPLVIGLIIVAFGTSAPEVAVNLSSLATGHDDLALGTIVGSNIFNVFFILGITALFIPLTISQKFIHVDVPILIGFSFLLWVLGGDEKMSQIDGLILIFSLISYIFLTFFLSKKEPVVIKKEYAKEYESIVGTAPFFKPLLFIILGVVILLFSSKLLVEGASNLAIFLGLSELIIGLTIVAGGSGTPEIAVSILAAKKKEHDIAVGTIIGSCIFNITFVLGLTTLVYPGHVISSVALNIDIPIMIASAIVCLPLFLTHARIERWEGGLLLFYFLAYFSFLILDAKDHDAAIPFGWVMMSFVIPMTVIALAITTWRYYTSELKA